MRYTLEDFYRNSPVPELRLLTKRTNFSEIPIESASFQEIPADDFIRSHELVLSTGAGCNIDKERYMEMLRFASESHAAAVIYTLRDESYAIPDSAIAYADEGGLPVLFRPWEYRLSDIHAFVIRQIQEMKLRIYQAVQTALFNCFFESRDLNCAAEEISTAFGMPAAILNRMGEIKGRSQMLPEEDCVPEKLEICINGELSGWLCLYGTGDLLRAREKLEKYVLSPLSLWFYGKNLEDMTVMKIKNNFVWDLANGKYDSLEEMTRQGRQLNFNLHCPYTCALLQVAAKEKELQEYSGKTARNMAAIESAILEIGKGMGLRLMVGDKNLHFIIYIENADYGQKHTPDQFLDAVDERLMKDFPEMTFYWGVSETTRETPEFTKLYHHASLALQYCMRTDGRRRFTFQDTRELQIISILSDQPEICQTAQEVLGRLIEYDAASRMDLVSTVKEYIRTNYNSSLTSRNLHLHRQSLLYRLEKIQDLTGLSLSDHKDLFLLEVYVRICFGL